MRITLLILLTLAVVSIQSTPQRGGRRFIPRGRRTTTESTLILDESPVEEEEVQSQPRRFTPSGRRSRPQNLNRSPARETVQEQPRRFRPSKPRVSPVTQKPVQQERPGGFKPTIRKLGSFKPKSASTPKLPSEKPVPVDEGPIEEAAPAVQVSQPTRSRGRGSRKFIESIKAGDSAGLSARQIDVIKSSGILRQSSRKPITRTQNPVSRQSSRVAAPRRPKTSSRLSKPVAPVVEELPQMDQEDLSPVQQPKEEPKNESARKQRLQQLKNRGRPSFPKRGKLMMDVPTVDKVVAEEIMMEDMKVATEELAKAEMKAAKLDDEEMKTIDETIKEETKIMEDKPMKIKEDAQEKGIAPMKKEDTVALDVVEPPMEKVAPEQPTTTAAPTTTTTSAAPTDKRVSSITRLRSQRPRSRTQGASRNRASTPVNSSSGDTSSTQSVPRLSTRRGGRGNSRGGASVASRGSRAGTVRTSSTFTPRVSSRSRTSAIEENPADDASPDQETTRRSRNKLPPQTRRRLPSLSARFARVKARRLGNEALPDSESKTIGEQLDLLETDDSSVNENSVNSDNTGSDKDVQNKERTTEKATPARKLNIRRNNRKLFRPRPGSNSLSSSRRRNPTIPRRTTTPRTVRRFRKPPKKTTTITPPPSPVRPLRPLRPSRQQAQSSSRAKPSRFLPGRRPRPNRKLLPRRSNERKTSPVKQTPVTLPVTTETTVPPTTSTTPKIITSTSPPSSTPPTPTTTATKPATPPTPPVTTTTEHAPRIVQPVVESRVEPEARGIKVAPEDPRDAVNRGGLKFVPHGDSERDLVRRNGEVVVTQIGTLENSPPEQVRKILSGLGGRRRGLARPSKSSTTTTTEAAFPDINFENYYYYDEDYYY